MDSLLKPLHCRLAYASLLAYDIERDPQNPSSIHIDPNTIHYGDVGFASPPVCFLQGHEDINAAFVAETTDDWVILSLRGTLPMFQGDFWKWVTDWLQDLEIGSTPWIVGNRVYGHVETGFATAVRGLWFDITSALEAIDLGSKKGILVTGHSKGAAMTSLAASLLHAMYPSIHTKVVCFAAPLTCDREFQANYVYDGLDMLTLRYQNENDIVPFLPYVPVLAMLATAERREGGLSENEAMTLDLWPENEYVALGNLLYIPTTCTPMIPGSQGALDALHAIEHALLHFEFGTIVDAHSMKARYTTCTCGS